MTDAALLALIRGDEQASAMVALGDDAGAAARVVAIAPPVLRSNIVNERGLYDAFASTPGLSPADAEAILQALATIGQTNPVVARASSWLRPDQGGLDMGSPATQAELAALAAAAPNVFTTQRMAVLVSLGQRPDTATGADVGRVMAPSRGYK